MTGTSQITQSIYLLTVPKFAQLISIKICQIRFLFCSTPAPFFSVRCGNLKAQSFSKPTLIIASKYSMLSSVTVSMKYSSWCQEIIQGQAITLYCT